MKEIGIAVSQFFQVRHLYSGKEGGQWSLITISANHGDLDLLQFIVNKIKLKKAERRIALFLAAWQGHLEVYEILMGRLRDKNPGILSQVNKERCRTPLHYAANNGHFGVCKLIIENTSDKNPASTVSFFVQCSDQ